MSADVVDLRDFYATPLGRAARDAGLRGPAPIGQNQCRGSLVELINQLVFQLIFVGALLVAATSSPGSQPMPRTRL
ncbi:MAG: hypothetical protein ACKOUS_19215, partial [Alphaproteobacteria bacterium]